MFGLVILNAVLHYYIYQWKLKKHVKIATEAGENPIKAQKKYDYDFAIQHDLHTIKEHLLFSSTNISMFIFQAGAIMYIRAGVGGLACIKNQNGKSYLAAQLDIECTEDANGDFVDPRFEVIRAKAILGLTGFVIVLAGVVFAMLNPFEVLHKMCDGLEPLAQRVPLLAKCLVQIRWSADHMDTSEVMHFAGEKMDQAYFWWDAVILVRKILMVLVASLAVSQGGAGGVATMWYCGSGITVVFLALHAFARPFVDELADTCEFLSLISMLMLFQAGIVFMLLNDPEDPRNNPANFDFNADGFIDVDEYNSKVVRNSFDSEPPAWDEIDWGDNGEPIDGLQALDKFGPWWTTNHSDVGHSLMRISIACIIFTIVYSLYAEIRIIYVISAREADGGIAALNDEIKKSLDTIQNEFTRHMTDIYNTAKKSVEEDDDLDQFSQALLGVLQQRELFADHRKVMSRVAVQTFLEIAQEPFEEANWHGSLNLYEIDPVTEEEKPPADVSALNNLLSSRTSSVASSDETVASPQSAAMKRFQKAGKQVQTTVVVAKTFNKEGQKQRKRERQVEVREGWEHWERDALARRNLKHDEEWVSRPGGAFTQGPRIIDTVMVEDTVIGILAAIGTKQELLDAMLSFHQHHVNENVNVEFNAGRIEAIKAIVAAKKSSGAERASTFEMEDGTGGVDDSEEFSNPLASGASSPSQAVLSGFGADVELPVTSPAEALPTTPSTKEELPRLQTEAVEEFDREMTYLRPFIVSQLKAKLEDTPGGPELLNAVLEHTATQLHKQLADAAHQVQGVKDEMKVRIAEIKASQATPDDVKNKNKKKKGK